MTDEIINPLYSLLVAILLNKKEKIPVYQLISDNYVTHTLSPSLTLYPTLSRSHLLSPCIIYVVPKKLTVGEPRGVADEEGGWVIFGVST